MVHPFWCQFTKYFKDYKLERVTSYHSVNPEYRYIPRVLSHALVGQGIVLESLRKKSWKCYIACIMA